MALQKEILKWTKDFSVTIDGETKTFTSGTGAVAGGIPGKIYDVAYGPVVHTITLDSAADIGSFVADHGVIINAPEYALTGTADGALVPSLTVRKGCVVSVMTAGHVWVKCGLADAILTAMNGKFLFGSKKPTGITEYVAAQDVNADAFVSKDGAYYQNKTGAKLLGTEYATWDAIVEKLTKVGSADDLCVIEINGVK